MIQAASHTKSAYRPEIDGLRALAVLVVIINHFNKDILPSGYLGVDIFFVVSGYVITSSLFHHNSSSFADLLLRFYSRRLKRLIPALILFVVITSILISLVNPEPGVMLGLGRRALFGVSNIQLFREATDYFAPSTELNPFTHTWSLGVEEQFYLLFPILVWLTGYGRLSHHEDTGREGSRRLFWILVGLSTASLIAFCFLYTTNQPAAYFLMPPRLWEIGFGCILFLAWRKNHQILLAMKMLPPMIITLAILAVMLLPVRYAVEATVSTAMLTILLIACLRKGTAAYSFFTWNPVIYIGKLSYSLYLWHWAIISISRWSIGMSWSSTILQSLLIVIAYMASYHYIETPLRYAEWSPYRWRTIGYGLGAPTVATLSTLLIGNWHEPLFLGKFKGKSFIYVQKHMECEMLSPNVVGNWKICLQRESNQPHIFILGDSHASNLVPSLKAAGAKHGYPSVRYLSNALKGRYSSYTSGNRDAAYFWENSATYKKFASSLKSGDLVVYSRAFTPSDDLDTIQAHIQLLTGSIKQSGARLLLVDAIPKSCGDSDFARSFIINPSKGCGISKRDVMAKRQQLTSLLKSKQKGPVNYVDPMDSLCEEERCYSTLYGKILHADPSPHFSIMNPAPLQDLFEKYLSRRKSND